MARVTCTQHGLFPPAPLLVGLPSHVMTAHLSAFIIDVEPIVNSGHLVQLGWKARDGHLPGRGMGPGPGGGR